LRIRQDLDPRAEGSAGSELAGNELAGNARAEGARVGVAMRARGDDFDDDLRVVA
jgi:hypothetical protein